MIKFGKKTDKVENIGILTKEEVEAYVDFLETEKNRHLFNITQCWKEMDLITVYPVNKEYDKATNALWKSAIRRHKKDIEGIDHLVETLRHFFSL